MRRAQTLAPGEEDAINAAVEARSLHVSPFPMFSTLDGLTTVLGAHGGVRSVRFRKHVGSLDFKGSAFVEFGSPEEAAAFLAKEIMHEGVTLVRRARRKGGWSKPPQQCCASRACLFRIIA